MTAEPLLPVRRLIQQTRDALHDGLQDRQRKPLARLTVGGCGDRLAREMAQMRAGGVAMDHLLDEELKGGDRVEEAFAPAVPVFMTGMPNGVWGEVFSGVGLYALP